MIRILDVIFGTVLLILIFQNANASELLPLYRGARAAAMGGAFVGLADDEQAVFLNPAGLAGVRNVTIHYLVADLDASYDAIATGISNASSLGNLSFNTISDVLMGKNIYGRAQITPTLIGQNFGVGILSDAQISIVSKNKALPQETIGYQFTNGIQFAFGFPLNRSSSDRIGELRLGFAGKVMWRRGGYQLMSLLDLMSLNADSLSTLAGNYAMGLGVDVGVHYIKKIGKSLTFSWGSSMTDLGDTAFQGYADPQRHNLTIGIGSKYELSKALTVTAVYDVKNITQDVDWRKRNHFGVELGFPFLTVYGGFNQTYLSYGAAFDLWLFRLTAASYAEEIGVLSFQDPVRRYMLRLGLKVGL
jgi:hypothetical protein